jgi:hypothetical protein
MTNDDPALSPRDAAKFCGMSLRSFVDIAARPDGPTRTQITDFKYGFRPSHLRAWIDSRAVPPNGRASNL